MNFHSHVRSQSAMEYLLTYGWTILIIAIVVIALFQLGLIGGPNLSSKATAAACQVVKTVQGSVLAGQCNGEWPQFVAQLSGSSSISVTPVQMPISGTSRTITGWVYPTSETGNHGIFYYGGTNCVPNGAVFGLILSGPDLYLWGSCDDAATSLSVPLNTWSFVAVSYGGGVQATIYLDNTNQVISWSSSVTCNSLSCTNAFIGGAPGWWGGQFSGNMANIQVYNVSLSQSDIQTLYQEGIGGAPVDPTHIVGWWPLNGNAHDYSGNNNQGTATSVSYNSSWSSGYVLT